MSLPKPMFLPQVLNKLSTTKFVPIVEKTVAPYIDLIDKHEYKKYMNLLSTEKPFLKLSHKDNILFLSQILKKIEDVNNKEFLEYTLKFYTDDSDKSDYSGVIGDLASYYAFPVSTLKYVIESFPDILPIEIIESQIKDSNGVSISYLTNRLNKIYNYNIMGETELKYIFDILQSKEEKHPWIDWIKEKIDSDYLEAQYPDWVSVEKGEKCNILDHNLWKSAEKISTPISLDDEEDEKLCEKTLDSLSFSSKDGKVNKDLVREVVKNAKGSRISYEDFIYPADPTRMFGPINGSRERDCLTPLISGKCRMLTCNCRDFDQWSDEEVKLSGDPYSWFEGNCHTCKHKILDVSHVIRFPIEGGGWAGTYCSVECMNKERPREYSEIGEIILESVFNIISTKGIFDRQRFKRKSVPKNKVGMISNKKSEYTNNLPQGLSRVNLE